MIHEANIIPLAGMAIPIVIVPASLIFKYEIRKREMEHQERMRALETGQPLPSRNAWPAAVVCSAIGAITPIAAFLITWMAVLTTSADHDIWIAPTFVSIFAVVAGARLAAKVFPSNPAASSYPTPAPHAKPVHDPDLYDTVGRRG